MQTILIRHGEVEGIDPPHFRGLVDLELLPAGILQAAATAHRVAGMGPFAALYSSPLRRCVDTAAPIGVAIGMSAKIAPAFTDIDYGQWQGMEIEGARRRFGSHVTQWLDAPHLTVLPSGEVLAGALARITLALDALLHAHGDGRIVIVTHDSVIRLILLTALDLPLSHYWTLRQDPCALTEITISLQSQTATFVNDSAHLVALVEG